MIEIDRSEYDRLFGQAYKWLRYDFARDLTHHDWEDLAQEAVIRLSSAIARNVYRPERGSLNAFFRMIVKNVAIEEFRRRERRVSSESGSEAAFDGQDVHEDGIGDLIEVMSLEELLRAHGPGIEDLLRTIGLTPAEKIALKLREMENMSAPEIGELLGITASSVRARWRTTRKKINAFLQRTGIETP